MQYNIHKNNFHDYFIIGILVSALVGTVQYSLLGHAFLAGMFCLPAAIKEIHISLKQKVQPIIAFMVTFISYAIISTLWTPQQDLLLREIWNLIWNTIIFLGLFNHARYANNPNDSFLKGLRILICSTLIIAAWEVTTNSHIPGFGDFNADTQIATEYGFEQRVFAAVTYRNLNTYVTLLCMALPFLIYGLFVLPHKWISLIAIVGSVLILIINSSRGGLMCLIVDLMIFACLYRKQQFAYKKTVTVVTLLAITFFIYRYGFIVAEQAIGRISSYGKEDIMADAGRWDVWRMGIEFCINSWGFGWGVGSMQPIYQSTGFWLHRSHNLVIEFLLQYGVWLFIPFGILLIKQWVYLIRGENISKKMLGLMLLLSFVPLVIIDDTYLTRTFFWIWLFMQFTITNNSNNSYENWHSDIPSCS